MEKRIGKKGDDTMTKDEAKVKMLAELRKYTTIHKDDEHHVLDGLFHAYESVKNNLTDATKSDLLTDLKGV